MSTRDDDEARAKSWLAGQGYEAARPTWLPRGKNPDFWAESAFHAPSEFWVEVKSIEPDDSTAAMERLAGQIRAARIPPDLRGHAMLALEPDTVEQSVRWVLKKFATTAPRFSGKKVSLVFIQQSKACDQEYFLKIGAAKPMVVWARASQLPLNASTAVRSEVLHAPTRVRLPDGTELIGPTYQFFEPRHPSQCVLAVHMDPEGRSLDGIDYMCGGNGQTRDRTARVLPAANAQIKTGCATRGTGCVLSAQTVNVAGRVAPCFSLT